MKKSVMKYFKRFGVIIMVSVLCITAKIDALAITFDKSGNYYALLSEIPEGGEDDYITLIEETEYEVKAGDTLWGISKEFLGDGARYQEIFEANNDIVSDADYILPGERLVISKCSYLHGVSSDNSYITENIGAFSIGTPWPADWKYSLTSYLYLGYLASGITIFDMPVTNRMEENELTQNWDDFVKEVKRCSEEICDGRVSNLTFEKYKVENGCDLCGYTFDFDTGDGVLELAAFYRLGAKNMVEVIGVCEKEEDSKLLEYTRYTAADFVDYGGQIDMGYTKTSDYNGADEWDYPELHNVFSAAMSSYVVSAERPEKNMPGDYEIEWEEPVLEQAVRNALIELWELNDAEKSDFLNRPLRASDVAVITDIVLSQYHSVEEDEEILNLVLNGYIQAISLGKNTDFSYADFSHFVNAESLSIAVGTTDFSFMKDMPHLKELYISGHQEKPFDNVDFLAGLKELKYLNMGGNEDAFSKITDLSVLKDSKKLKYLFLTMPQLSDFSFLEECTEICTIELRGTIEKGIPAMPDLELLPNARFIEFYGESLRWEY